MQSASNYMTDPGRLLRLAEAKAPDRQRWGAASSYNAGWAHRGALAAGLVPDGARVLEIGAGTGTFAKLISDRCRYTGADLEPLDPAFIALDLDRDPLPAGPWDAIVLLGVLEYLHNFSEALDRLAAATPMLVLSYCCRTVPRVDNGQMRLNRGWVSALSEEELTLALMQRGFAQNARIPVNQEHDFTQAIFQFKGNQ